VELLQLYSEVFVCSAGTRYAEFGAAATCALTKHALEQMELPDNRRTEDKWPALMASVAPRLCERIEQLVARKLITDRGITVRTVEHYCAAQHHDVHLMEDELRLEQVRRENARLDDTRDDDVRELVACAAPPPREPKRAPLPLPDAHMMVKAFHVNELAGVPQVEVFCGTADFDTRLLEEINAPPLPTTLARTEAMLFAAMYPPHQLLHVFVDVSDSYLQWILLCTYEAVLRRRSNCDLAALRAAIERAYKQLSALQTHSRELFNSRGYKNTLHIGINECPELGSVVGDAPTCFMLPFYSLYRTFIAEAITQRLIALLSGRPVVEQLKQTHAVKNGTYSALLEYSVRPQPGGRVNVTVRRGGNSDGGYASTETQFRYMFDVPPGTSLCATVFGAENFYSSVALRYAEDDDTDSRFDVLK